jgi:hypothetical protein
VVADRGREVVAALADRQVRVGDLGDGRPARRDEGLALGDLTLDLLQLGRCRRPQLPQSPAQPGGVGDRQAVEARPQVARAVGQGVSGAQ